MALMAPRCFSGFRLWPSGRGSAHSVPPRLEGKVEGSMCQAKRLTRPSDPYSHTWATYEFSHPEKQRGRYRTVRETGKATPAEPTPPPPAPLWGKGPAVPRLPDSADAATSPDLASPLMPSPWVGGGVGWGGEEGVVND